MHEALISEAFPVMSAALTLSYGSELPSLLK